MISSVASSADELLPPRAYGIAARVLGVFCVLAMGMAVLYIAGGAGPEPDALVAQPAQTVPALEDAPAGPGPAAAAVAAAEAVVDPATELGVVVFDRTSGEIAVGARGDQPYFGAALAKVVLAVDILDRRRLDDLQVSRSSIALLRSALGPNDDDAMDTLWDRFDGPGAAARVSARLGLTGTTAPESRSRWAQMGVPAADVVRIWEYILEEIPPADRELLVSAVQAAPPTAGDGFDQAFGLRGTQVRGPRAAVAEQAWLCCVDGERYLHSAGAFGPDQRYVAAFLTRVPRDRGWEPTRSEVDAAVGAALGALG